MATARPNTTKYGNPFVKGLAGDSRWSSGDTVYYYLDPGSGTTPSSGYPTNWTAASMGAAFDQAAAAWSAVADVGFARTTSLSQADIVETLYSDPEDGLLGEHEFPAEGRPQGRFNIGQSEFSSASNAKGGFGFMTILHELGHALGLKHPFDGATFPGVTEGYFDSRGDNDFNGTSWTVMAYDEDYWNHFVADYSYSFPVTPMAFDIAALQAIYGANMETGKGDDVYEIPVQGGPQSYRICIWDAAGNDTLSAAKAAVGSTIDLRAATLKNAYGGGGFMSHQGPFANGDHGMLTIAHGAVIENAVGSRYGDHIIGNAADNRIDGGGGNDEMTGGGGRDVFVARRGGGGSITDFERGKDSIDISAIDARYYRVTSSNNASDFDLRYRVSGGWVAFQINGTYRPGDFFGDLPVEMRLTLGGRSDVLSGGKLNDSLDGMGGNDTLHGGAGDDTLRGGQRSDVLYGDDGDDRLEAGTGSDTLHGGRGDDIISLWNEGGGAGYGGGGDDTLTGGPKSTLYGGPGDDTYGYVRGATIVEDKHGGVDTVEASIDFVLPSYCENLVMPERIGFGWLHDYAQDGSGNELANAVTGNRGTNVIAGLAGDDTLDGGMGDDTLDGGGGADRMVGGMGDDVFIVDDAKDVVVERSGPDAPKAQYFRYVGSNDEVRASVSYTLTANVEHLTLTGAAAIDGVGTDRSNRLTGNDAANRLRGLAGNDTLNGAGGDDRLIGGAGRDLLTGGTGADTFVWKSGELTAKTRANADRVVDFSQAEGDRLDLSAAGHFAFVGMERFSGTAGELRYETGGGTTYLSGDLDGDGQADFVIKLEGRIGLTAADFVL